MAARTERAYGEAGQHRAQHGQGGLPTRARERGCQEVLPARRVRYAHDLRARKLQITQPIYMAELRILIRFNFTVEYKELLFIVRL